MNGASPELSVGLEAVRRAARLCQHVQSGITPEALAKKDKSPVTIADFGSQALICRDLMLAFPEDPVIGEEGADELRAESGTEFLERVVAECRLAGAEAGPTEICDWIDRGGADAFSRRFWTLDPIDGTKGFLRGEQYAISLALILDGQIEIGILGCPNLPFAEGQETGVLAWAVRGFGAWQQPLGNPDAQPVALQVTPTSTTRELVFCESVESGHSSHGWSGQIAEDLQIHREPVRMDSQCKYLAVARGDADVYLRLPTRAGYEEKIWDHAGGVLLVEEAGGQVTDINGAVSDFRQGSTLAKNEGMVASNGRVHPFILQSIQRHRPAEST